MPVAPLSYTGDSQAAMARLAGIVSNMRAPPWSPAGQPAFTRKTQLLGSDDLGSCS
jgi:hypothetical protein